MFADLTLAALISRMLALLVGMTFHEFMHNFVAWQMGDPTPEREGRLTLNPLVHINWLGFLMFAVVGFGVLGTAPIHPNLMNYPRVRWADRLTRVQRLGVSVLAGPLANLIVAAVFAVPFRILLAAAPSLIMSSGSRVLPSLGTILIDMVQWNVLLFVFNLIPLGPLDGRYILGMFLPPQMYYQYENFQNQYGMFILFGLILLSFFAPAFNIFGLLIGQPSGALTRLLLGL